MAQVHDHLSVNNLYEQFQSGFHSCHSTETALVKADSGLLSILIIFELTSVFDNISHKILLDCSLLEFKTRSV